MAPSVANAHQFTSSATRNVLIANSKKKRIIKGAVIHPLAPITIPSHEIKTAQHIGEAVRSSGWSARRHMFCTLTLLTAAAIRV